MGHYEIFQGWSDSYDDDIVKLGWSSPVHVSNSIIPLIKSPKSVIDIAIGTGELTLELKKSFPDTEYHGVDFSEKMLHQARMKKVTDNLIKLNVETDNFPHPDNSFDIAAASGLGEFINNPSLLISEMYRLVKSGGVIAITCPKPELNNGNSMNDKISESFANTGITEYKVDNFHAYTHEIGIEAHYNLFVARL